MFGLIRRLSGSVIPRQDRPWAEDATSNAPQKRKRRRSWDDPEQVQRNKSNGKRSRAFDLDPESPVAEQATVPLSPTVENEEVRTVTEGVKEVALEDKSEKSESPSTALEPHAVPLPAEDDQEELKDDAAITETQSELPETVVEQQTVDVKIATSEPGPLGADPASEAAITTSSVEAIDVQEQEHSLPDTQRAELSEQGDNSGKITAVSTEVPKTGIKESDIKAKDEPKDTN